ncbi:GNAT family N-acetyltransferase [Staphylococcus hyicus]|uniref:GNAT family N-acetyltransferase n=1 Tax=Staphylococcus hyicus TaxID=1284 RepID=UPI00208F4087|nr:GNAT family N-acetyltransferase [Staphylococcus hyicus]MCO4328739.1 GNAT family N-acetyltransferase [Staphylococcus hyicus]MCO4330712.1 GNAT family N-acetyltransferase [Staphylococcus hyicus]MCO4333110.1 GNAT family N-acetyltransferase [Staphylococcus hyicus]MCO4337104.1 GNAT family N-acetyltransferase [Staphylococcus hyicus]
MIKVRRKTCKDTPDIAKVHYVSYIDTYKGLLPEVHLDAQTEESYLKKHQMFNTDCLVAEKDHQIVGFIMYGPARDDDLNDAFEIYSVYILPEYQHQGIGTHLIQKAEGEMASQAKHILLWVVDTNFDTIRFYKKHGYQFDGAEIEDEGYREQRMVKK